MPGSSKNVACVVKGSIICSTEAGFLPLVMKLKLLWQYVCQTMFKLPRLTLFYRLVGEEQIRAMRPFVIMACIWVQLTSKRATETCHVTNQLSTTTMSKQKTQHVCT